MQPVVRAILALAICLVPLLMPEVGYAAVTISRAELSGTTLRLEGDHAIARASIVVDGISRGQADDRGRFKLSISGYTSATCRAAVNDGTGVVNATLSGCTPARATPTPTPPAVVPRLQSLGLSPTSVTGGATVTGFISLTTAAPTGGALVSLGSTNTSIATVPASVNVPAGVNDATFTLTTLAVSASSVVNITAAYGGVSANSPLTVTAAPATPPPGGGGSVGVINALTITPDAVFGGESALGTVTLTASVTTNTVVTLTSFDTTVATVPASVTVPAGATSATFTITTKPVFGEGTFSWINGNAGGQDRGASMNVNPGALPTAPSVVSVVLSPANLGGGGAATGTVTLSGPANDGALITITSSNPSVVQVPSEMFFVARTATTAFPITTTTVSSTTNVTLTVTARCCGAVGSRTAVITVTTAPPPPPDVVRVTAARWQRCIISVSGTSTNPNAILMVWLNDSNSPMFQLTNLGGGRYSFERSWRPPGTNVPVNLSLRSNLGGRANFVLADPQGFVCRADL